MLLLLGVCNTDNFSLLSITIDYGPFGFMDDYDPGNIVCYNIGLYTCNPQGGMTASWLLHSSLDLSPTWDIMFCSWARHTVAFPTQVYEWLLANVKLKGNSIPSRVE